MQTVTFLQIRADPDTLQWVERYRAAQAVTPTRTGAIKALLQAGYINWWRGLTDQERVLLGEEYEPLSIKRPPKSAAAP